MEILLLNVKFTFQTTCPRFQCSFKITLRNDITNNSHYSLTVIIFVMFKSFAETTRTSLSYLEQFVTETISCSLFTDEFAYFFFKKAWNL